MLIAERIDILTASRRLGHARPSTTSDIYGHVIERVDESAASILDEKFLNISAR
jgi:integrase